MAHPDAEHLTDSTPLDGLLRAGDAWDPVDERRALSAIKESLLGSGVVLSTEARYLPVERIGAGGIGVVYRAYDPKLQREVALKVVRPRGRGTESDADARTRLLREAQALASLSHPNVVTIYDVGISDDEVFITMEYVQGTDVSKWLREEKRDWQIVLDVFIRAGRGLAAAHAAGLLHRDFKPSNILLDQSMRPRVIDFGLARLADEVVSDTPSEVTKPDTSRDSEDDSLRIPASFMRGAEDALSTQLTVAGTVMGTPGYMAPEQYRGEATSARSDQFSFCAALYEGLYGRLPFAARRKREIAEFLEHGEIRPPPDGSEVPGRIYRALVRGLSLDAEDRFPAMDALLEELAKDPWRRRRRWIAGSAAAAVVAGAAWGILGAQADVCAGGEDRAREAWSPAHAAQIEQAFKATGLDYAADTAQRVRHNLDGYARRWVDARRSACEATQRGEQSAELLDRRMVCYERAMREVGALVGLLSEADTQVVETSVSATLALTRLDTCDAERMLSTTLEPPPDEETERRVEDVRDRIADARAVLHAGKSKCAAEELEALAREADAIGYGPLVAEVAVLLGPAMGRLSEFDRSVESLRKAYFTALANNHDRVAAMAATSLLMVYTAWKGDASGFEWAEHARAEIARIGDAPLLTGDLHHALGVAHLSLGNHDPALESYERARAIFEEKLGPQAPEIANVLKGVANVLSAKAMYDDAALFAERTVAINEDLFGPRHPQVADALATSGSIHRMQGRLDEALAEFRRALEIFETSLDSETVVVAEAHNGIGAVLASRGEFRGAKSHFERAERIYSKLEDEELERQNALINIAEVNYALGRLEEAQAGYRSVLDTWEATYEPTHPNVIVAVSNLARVETELGNHEVALALHDRAIKDGIKGHGPDHPILSQSYYGRGRSRVETGHVERGIADLERALELLQRDADHEIHFAETHEALARAIVETDQDRAKRLAEVARSWYAERRDTQAWRLRRLERWMDQHDLR